jgi:hypothetical protein
MFGFYAVHAIQHSAAVTTIAETASINAVHLATLNCSMLLWSVLSAHTQRYSLLLFQRIP